MLVPEWFTGRRGSVKPSSLEYKDNTCLVYCRFVLLISILIPFQRNKHTLQNPPPVVMPTFTVFKGSKDGVQKTTTTKPDQLSGDQVLLKVTASGLCGTDLHYVKLPALGPGAIPG